MMAETKVKKGKGPTPDQEKDAPTAKSADPLYDDENGTEEDPDSIEDEKVDESSEESEDTAPGVEPPSSSTPEKEPEAEKETDADRAVKAHAERDEPKSDMSDADVLYALASTAARTAPHPELDGWLKAQRHKRKHKG